ncbi:endospore germination permease [Clostridiaceae bacterium M8S5]|nr:endospore germination permease [Clostridiaceae bacterium M8S5]
MERSKLTSTKMVIILIMYLTGTTAQTVTGIDAKEDFWISTIISVVFAVPLVFTYSKLLAYYPKKNLFEIYEICYGRKLSKIIMALHFYYFLDGTTSILLNFTYFAKSMLLYYTPNIAFSIGMMLLCIWVAREGIITIGNFANAFLLLFIILILSPVILSATKMNLNNIKPTYYNGIKPILMGTYKTFTFPFAQMTAFTMIFTNFKDKESPFRMYMTGLIIGSVIVIIMSSTSVLLLGVPAATKLVYPIYTAMARVNIARTLQGIEVILSVVFVFGVFIKIAIYLIATSKGFVKLFDLKDYKTYLVPLSLFIIILAKISFRGILDYWSYTNSIWPVTAIIFDVILPILTVLVAYIRVTLAKAK